MINEFLTQHFTKNNKKRFIGSRKTSQDEFQWSTYDDIFIKAHHLASFLIKNVEIPPKETFPFGTVCICSENREEWLISDIACGLNGLVTVGFHSSWPLDESITIASDVYASVAIVSSSQLEYFQKISEKQKSLKLIICMDDVECDNVVKLSDIYKMPIEPFENLENEYHTIIYSSGTTGSPKGLPVTRKRWLYDALNGPFDQNERSVYVSFSNLAHGMDRGVAWQLMNVGGEFAFSRGDFESVIEDCKTVEPSLIMSMPHFWNDLYYYYRKMIQDMIVDYLKTKEKVNDPSQTLVDLIISSCDQKSDNPIVQFILKAADERISKSIGTKCKVIGTGGSSISDQVLNFLNEKFKGASIVNSYGTTEVPGISTNGVISTNVELKLIDCPQYGYVSNETVKEGEIVVKMPDIVTFYWGKREASIRSSKENFKDGWYYTQDIGRIDSSGKLSIIDRKSDLAELYVDGRSVWIPIQPVENVFLSNSKLFTHIYLHGDRAQSFLVAVVVPIKGQKVTQHQVYQEIVKTARENKLETSKIPRAVVISDHEWTPETGELSQTRKLKRGTLLKNFKMQIDEEYARINHLDEEKEKIMKDQSFDYIDYKFLCDDDENSKILNQMFQPVRESVLQLREIAPLANKRLDENEAKVVKETEEIKNKCLKENDESFQKISQNKDSLFNFLNTLSKNKEILTEACKKREDARYEGDSILQKADGEVNKYINLLVEKADEIGEKLPYQIFCGLVKLSPEKIKERNGNCLSESKAPSCWEVWCDACGILIEVGKHGEGTARYKCLDCDKVYCSRCFEMFTKLRESHKNLPFDCFTKSHYLSKEYMKFIRAGFLKLKSSNFLNEIFDGFCSKYENRIFIDKNENSPVLITYKEAKNQLNESDNVVLKTIKEDIEKNEKELIRKTFEVVTNDWPLIVHVKKDQLDSSIVWNTMYNGGRLVLDN